MKNLHMLSALFVILIFFSAEQGLAASSSKALGIDHETTDMKKIYWFEGQHRKWAFQAEDEVAVIMQTSDLTSDVAEEIRRQIDPDATLVTHRNRLVIVRTPAKADPSAIGKQVKASGIQQEIRNVTPVFYRSRAKQSAGRLLLSGEIIVRFPEQATADDIEAIEDSYGVEPVRALGFSPNTFVYKTIDPGASIDTANNIHASGETIYAYPNWIKQRAKKMVPNDPLFASQWHLRNTGQSGGTSGEDVNITGVWDNYLGSTSEVIGIVDEGVEIGHQDLIPNVIPDESYDFVEEDTDPSPTLENENHGTACAGVAAARGNNEKGVSGAAPNAGLVGVRLFNDDFFVQSKEARALTYNSDLIDIYSNSWGPADEGIIDGPDFATKEAIASGAANGRGGLGSIYVWAGGNGYNGIEDSNTDGYANNRYTIAVAASGDDGVQAAYSETGANIFVNAPSSGNNADSGIVTTDRPGADGYDDTSNYYDGFGGTSAASPLVSGIIALMLQANPDLTWRDVHHIILQTAEKNTFYDNDWSTNSAGFHVNHKYGFGRIDALAAVTASETWTTVPAQITPTTAVTSSPNLPIPDDYDTGVNDTITITDNVAIEYVEVCFSANHEYYGDLYIELTSPQGAESILALQTRYASRAYTYEDWCFGTVRHYGEPSQGPWRLTVSDRDPTVTGTFQSWSLKFYGTAYNGSHTITASSGSGGSLSSEGAIAVVNGWHRVFTVDPNPGFSIEDVLVDGVSVGAVTQYTFQDVSADHTISATFTPNGPTHTITATAGSGGIILPSGDVIVVETYSQPFGFYPNDGYTIDAVLVDGSRVGQSSPYTFEDIDGNHTIEVTFTPTTTSSGSSGGGGNSGCFIETID